MPLDLSCCKEVFINFLCKRIIEIVLVNYLLDPYTITLFMLAHHLLHYLIYHVLKLGYIHLHFFDNGFQNALLFFKIIE